MKALWELLKANRAIFYILTAGAGLAIGLLVLFWEDIFMGQNAWIIDEAQGHPKGVFFNEHPKFLLWTFLIITQAGVFVALLNPLLRQSRTIRHQFKIHATEWWLTYIYGTIVLLLTAFFVAVVVGEYFMAGSEWGIKVFPLAHSQYKFLALNLLGYGVAMSSIAGMVITSRASIKLDEIDENRVVECYRLLRRSMRFFLLSLGIQVGLATLATNALQEAINDHYSLLEGAIFPVEFVWAYGLFLSLLLLLVFVPVNQRVTEAGNKLKRKIEAGTLVHEQVPGKKTTLEQDLGLQRGLKQNLELVLTIMAPILGALMPALFGVNG